MERGSFAGEVDEENDAAAEPFRRLGATATTRAVPML